MTISTGEIGGCRITLILINHCFLETFIWFGFFIICHFFVVALFCVYDIMFALQEFNYVSALLTTAARFTQSHSLSFQIAPPLSSQISFSYLEIDKDYDKGQVS